MTMRFEHEFTVPVPVEQAWSVLLDVQRVAPCLPGAALDSVDDDVSTGRMKVKVGPITVTYRGKASFESVDKDAHTLRLRASGKEMRGTGTAGAVVDATLAGEGASTRVTVETSFNVTGRPAQFGRGVMAEVGAKLIDRFAENLAALLRETPERTLTVVPDEAVPEAAVPEAALPETAVPEAARPDEAVPEAAVPGETLPCGTVPGTAEAPPAPEPAGEVEPGALVEPATTPFNTPEPSPAASVPGAEPVAEVVSPFGAPAEAGGLEGAEEPEGAAPRSGPDGEADGEATAQRHLTAVPDSYAERAAGREAHPAGTTRTSRTPDEEALDLLRIAGVPLLKRAAPLVAALAGVVLLGWLVRRLHT
ncbi:SRPBCC domain-containing protein, partial [Sphaerisporangium sp. NPDC051011]|uniref:SRPBCC domain-containing protein n=1 Tax=Sphaerisporangium sp. NPDC051011 TaxID=3155792 RepID=UPI00340A6E83